MKKSIAVCRRVAVRNLARRLGLFKNNPTFRGDENMVDKNVNQKLMAGLVDCDSINKIKMMGAFVNPMFQNVRWMMSAGLCTKKQHDAGEEEILQRMKQMIDYSILDNGNEPIKNTTETKAGNEWDDSDNEYDNINISKAAGSAREEIGVFYS